MSNEDKVRKRQAKNEITVVKYERKGFTYYLVSTGSGQQGIDNLVAGVFDQYKIVRRDNIHSMIKSIQTPTPITSINFGTEPLDLTYKNRKIRATPLSSGEKASFCLKSTEIAQAA